MQGRGEDLAKFTLGFFDYRPEKVQSNGRLRRPLRQGAPKRMAADLKFFGNFGLGVIAGTQERARLFQVRLGE